MQTKTKLTLKQWSDADKPREKLLSQGADYLTDAELIAILIGSGNKKETAVELSRRILSDNSSNLNKLAKLSVNDLIKYNGIGEAKAISIVAALELGKRRAKAKIIEKNQILSPEDAFEYICPHLCDIKHEEFWTIFLDSANKIISRSKIAQGAVNQINIDIKIIIKKALDNYAVNMILCHNHPSENLSPSNSDINLTDKIKKAAELFNIAILDHIIVAGNKFYSFKEAQIL